MVNDMELMRKRNKLDIDKIENWISHIPGQLHFCIWTYDDNFSRFEILIKKHKSWQKILRAKAKLCVFTCENGNMQRKTIIKSASVADCISAATEISKGTAIRCIKVSSTKGDIAISNEDVK